MVPEFTVTTDLLGLGRTYFPFPRVHFFLLKVNKPDLILFLIFYRHVLFHVEKYVLIPF